MMKDSIISIIEKLKHSTETVLKQIQISRRIPILYQLKYEQKFSYEIQNLNTNLYEDNKSLYLINNLPFINVNRLEVIDMNMIDAVSNNILQPFLLFIDKKFIKWSDINIISDNKNSYIKINNITEFGVLDCILLPYDIIYKEDNKVINSNTIFMFDGYNYANIYTTNKAYTTIELPKHRYRFYESISVKFNKNMKSSLDYKYPLYKENMICFKNGMLYTTAKINLLAANTFNISEVSSSELICKIFYYTNTNDNKNNLMNIPNKDFIVNNILNNNINEYIKNLNVNYDFTFDKNKTYEENIANALEYTMGYNSGLMNELYKQNSNIISRIYTGKYIKSLANIDGKVKMSCRIDKNINNAVMIFVNGKLYNHYNELVYINKDFCFPCIGINDNDNIEIIYIKNIDNSIIKMILHSDTNLSTLVNPNISEDDIVVFSNTTLSSTYPISNINNIEIQIDAEVTKTDDYNINIIPKESFYYDKLVSVVSKRQFRYFFTYADGQSQGFKLPNEFTYCNNIDNYMIFINGNKIDRVNFKVTIPSFTRPFDEVAMFTNMYLNKGDKIEVFYIGNNLKEFIIQSTISSNGDIIIDKSILGYPLTKDLYLFFINGKKINNNDIVDIGCNKVRILNRQTSVSNLCIIKHIDEEETIKILFNNKNDLYNSIVNSIQIVGDTNILFGRNTITATDPNIKSAMDMKYVLYDIIMKYWLRPSILEYNNTIIYDFEDSNLLDKDSDGNIILPLDANANNYIQ